MTGPPAKFVCTFHERIMFCGFSAICFLIGKNIFHTNDNVIHVIAAETVLFFHPSVGQGPIFQHDSIVYHSSGQLFCVSLFVFAFYIIPFVFPQLTPNLLLCELILSIICCRRDSRYICLSDSRPPRYALSSLVIMASNCLTIAS